MSTSIQSTPRWGCRSRHARRRGTTLIESALAVAVVAIGLAGAVTVNSTALKIGRSCNDVANAQQTLRSVVEMVRNTTWAGATSTAYLQGTLLAPGTVQFPALSQLTVLVEVSPYPLTAGNSAETISATRNADGTVSITGAGNGNLVNETVAKVRINATWSGGRMRTQEAVAIISRGGILGVNH